MVKTSAVPLTGENESMSKQFLLPDLGEGITEAQIVRVLIKTGDMIAEDQYLVEVETDKAAVEIPSPYAGIAESVHVEEGQTVNVGDVLVTFGDGGAPAGAAAAKASAPSSVPSTATVTAPQRVAPAPTAVAPPPFVDVPASGRTVAPAAPVVRKLAREMGLNLDTIQGSGPGGRITKEDLQRAGAGQTTSTPQTLAAAVPARSADAVAALVTPLPGTPDTDKWGQIYREPLNQIRKTIANHMTRSARTAVHVTHGDEADITSLDKLRRDLNESTQNDPKLTFMSFLIRATCIALRKYPIFNSSFDEEGGQIIYKGYINMGIAVDTERGLIVPVIRDVDRLTLRGIAGALRGIADRIRSNRFAIEDLRGGTFTITNVGALGGTFSTPIINHPEVAILGLGRSRKVPVVRDGQLAEVLSLPLNLSFDHRVTDGANAARFTREIISFLEMPAKFLLDG